LYKDKQEKVEEQQVQLKDQLLEELENF